MNQYNLILAIPVFALFCFCLYGLIRSLGNKDNKKSWIEQMLPKTNDIKGSNKVIPDEACETKVQK